MTITARYAGRCRRCGRQIEAGESVEWSREGGTTCAEACEAAPRETQTREEHVAITDPGVYERDGIVYVVKPNRDKTRLYAKRLVEINAERATEDGDRVHVEFVYAPGAVYQLTPEDRMPLDRAKELTIRYGRCISCGRHLKAAESVERGIGPVCVKNFAVASSEEIAA